LRRVLQQVSDAELGFVNFQQFARLLPNFGTHIFPFEASRQAFAEVRAWGGWQDHVEGVDQAFRPADSYQGGGKRGFLIQQLFEKFAFVGVAESWVLWRFVDSAMFLPERTGLVEAALTRFAKDIHPEGLDGVQL